MPHNPQLVRAHEHWKLPQVAVQPDHLGTTMAGWRRRNRATIRAATRAVAPALPQLLILATVASTAPRPASGGGGGSPNGAKLPPEEVDTIFRRLVMQGVEGEWGLRAHARREARPSGSPAAR